MLRQMRQMRRRGQRRRQRGRQLRVGRVRRCLGLVLVMTVAVLGRLGLHHGRRRPDDRQPRRHARRVRWSKVGLCGVRVGVLDGCWRGSSREWSAPETTRHRARCPLPSHSASPSLRLLVPRVSGPKPRAKASKRRRKCKCRCKRCSAPTATPSPARLVSQFRQQETQGGSRGLW